MPFTLTMPKLSPTMEGGTIVKWHAKEGDNIKAGDLLFEVATDKATVEYNAIDQGFLRKILIGENHDAKVNHPVAIFAESMDESIEGLEAPAEEEKSEPSSSEKESSEQKKPEKQQVGFTQVAFTPEPPLENYKPNFAFDKIEGKPFASPLAKKLAKEKGVDLTTVQGSGPDQRIMSRDLDLAQPDTPAAFGRKNLPTTPPGSYVEEKMSPMRKVIGERLQASKSFIPHFYVQQEVDATPMMETRNQLKEGGIKVTFNDFVMKACSLALRENPNVNSGFNSKDNTIIRFETIDIAVAVSVDGGLITPIVRHADYKDLGQISTEVRVLAKRAQEGKLQPEEYKGGSFSVSNLGMFGISDFRAVINPPQAAILAVGGIIDKPVIKNGKIVPGKTMTISLSSDHRVIDGKDAALFVKSVQKFLENPYLLII